MHSNQEEIKHFFREVLGRLSVNEIMSNEKLIKKSNDIERIFSVINFKEAN